MRRFMLGAMTAAIVAACSDSPPFGAPEDDTGTPATIPASVAGDLVSITYDPAAGTLIVRGFSGNREPLVGDIVVAKGARVSSVLCAGIAP